MSYIKNKNKYIFKLFLLFLFWGIFLYGISKQYTYPIYSWSGTWYSTSWLYRKELDISNPGGTLNNEDVMVILDTATEITGGRLQSDCDDLRFIDSDDSTILSYWIEGGCNTTTTHVWVRVPTIATGTKTIYAYFGNPSATAGATSWGGTAMLFADASCPTGWTRVTAFDNKFPYGSTTYGSTGGTDVHSHGTTSGTSTSLSGSSVTGLSGTTTGAASSHTHTTLQGSVDTLTEILPSYLDMVICSNTDILVPTGLISMFNTTVPTGWTRFSALDGKFPKGASTYGGTGGSDTHTHTLTTGVTTGTASATQTSLLTVQASGGTETMVGDDRLHRFNSSDTLTVTQGGNVEVLVVGGGGNGGTHHGGGGGGGDVRYNSSFAISSGSISVTVGANSQSSVFSSITAVAGGKGGTRDGAAATSGANGGGGGGGYNSSDSAAGSATHGYAGGNGYPSGAANASGGGGGGHNAVGQVGTSNDGGDGGAGTSNSITGSAVIYGSGGGGMGYSTYGNGGSGAGHGGTNTVASTAGTANRGGGGGGRGYAGGGYGGGSGVVLVRYYFPYTGEMASGSHTHTSDGGTVSSAAGLPSYLTMIYGKANASIYTDEKNIVMASSLPPYGWTRFTALDSKFPRGGSSYGGTGGTTTHTHSVTIDTGSPSALVNYYGTTGNTFASNSHTHSVTVTSPSGSTIPPYNSTIFMQRKASLSITRVGGTVSFNADPNAPSSLLTEAATNPTGVTDTTPEFSAVFTDPDTGNTAPYYQIQVNTNSSFSGTVMWDSGLQSVTPISNGSRSPDISYAGTTLTLDGTTYYWRMKFSDNYGFVSSWSSTAQFSINATPNIPSTLYTEGSSNPIKVTDTTPEFSAVFSDTDSGDTGVYYEIEVNTNSAFTGTVMWDSNKTSISTISNGSRSSDISYAGTALSISGTKYYWRIRFWDNRDTVSDWSATANFTMSGAPSAPTELLTDGLENPTLIASLNPKFTAIYQDPNQDSSSAVEINVNSNNLFTGTVMWNSGKVSSVVDNNTRSSEYSYNGTILTGISGNIYYWRIRFWDSDDQVGEWSETAQFTDKSSHVFLDGVKLDGLTIE